MPPVKELHYFDHLYIKENRNWTGEHIRTNVAKSLQWHASNNKISLEYFRYLIDLATERPFTEEWYKKSFSWPGSNGKMTGDITPEYCMIPEEGIAYVQSLLGSVKIIVMLREPISRAISQIRMNAARGGIDLESASVDKWLELSNETVIASRARYDIFPEKWVKMFGASNLHFVDYNNVVERPLTVLRNLESFLGLPAGNYLFPDQPVHVGSKLTRSVPREVIEVLNSSLSTQSKAYLGLLH